jgi:hypothetical protein
MSLHLVCQSNRTLSALSQRDMSDKITVSRSCRPFHHLYGIHRRSSNFYRHAHRSLFVGIKPEQTDRAVLLSKRWPAYVEHVFKPFEIDRAIHAQVGPSASWQVAG